MKYPNDLIVRKDALDAVQWWIEEYPEIPKLDRVWDDIDSLPRKKFSEEELIETAKGLGYVCFKRKEWVSLMKCPICNKKPLEWGSTGHFVYECPNGHLIGTNGTRRQARLSWNEEVERHERSD